MLGNPPGHLALAGRRVFKSRGGVTSAASGRCYLFLFLAASTPAPRHEQFTDRLRALRREQVEV
jgi:hypothetical protein